MGSTWSTGATVRRQQVAYWRELICQAFLDLTPETDLRDGFAGTVTQWPLGRSSIARIDSQRQHVRRTERDIARAGLTGHYANLQVRGTSYMAQDGRETTLRPGDIGIVACDRRFAFGFGTDFRQLAMYLPPGVLDAGVPTATRVDTFWGVGAAVRHAMHAAASDTLAPRPAARLASYAAGLLGIAVDDTRSTVDRSRFRTRGGHEAAVADIEEHLADDDLAPAATARRLGVSVRWVHAQFAGREHSYAGTVRRLRLERARRDLCDPALRHLRVIDVAADAGFGDVTAFHRAFRRELGVTPGQVRSSGSAEASTVD
jgi:AraC family transcriptional activator of tynA and feaB